MPARRPLSRLSRVLNALIGAVLGFGLGLVLALVIGHPGWMVELGAATALLGALGFWRLPGRLWLLLLDIASTAAD